MPKRGEVIVIEQESAVVVDLRGWARLYAREVLEQHAREQRDAGDDAHHAHVLQQLPKAG